MTRISNTLFAFTMLLWPMLLIITPVNIVEGWEVPARQSLKKKKTHSELCGHLVLAISGAQLWM